MKQVTVVIADDQASTRHGLKALLAFEPRIVVVGEARSGDAAVRQVGEKHPDLVLMDVEMPFLDGMRATCMIKSTWPDVRVVVYTLYPEYQQEASKAGADYFMVKGSSDPSLSQVILSFFPEDQ